MNTLNLLTLLVCISIVINVVLFIILLYNFSYIKEAIDVFDRGIAKILQCSYENVKFNTKFDKAFFDKNKFEESDIAFVGIITKVDDNDKNEIKDKIDKK